MKRATLLLSVILLSWQYNFEYCTDKEVLDSYSGENMGVQKNFCAPRVEFRAKEFKTHEEIREFIKKAPKSCDHFHVESQFKFCEDLFADGTAIPNTEVECQFGCCILAQ